jgi:hypothetical protein
MVTNLPMIFPLFKTWLRPWFTSAMRSSSQKKTYELRNPTGFRTIGGGGGGGGGTIGGGGGVSRPSNAYSKNRSRAGHGMAGSSSHAVSTNMTFDNDSEEMIVDDHKLGSIQVTVDHPRMQLQQNHPATGIMVLNQVDITHEDKSSQVSDARTENVRDAW